MELNNITFDKKYIDCEIHGNSEALLNNKCAACFKEVLEKEKVKEYNQRKLLIKRDINIPLRYFEATFDSYIPDNEKSVELKRLCEEYKYDTNLILVGTVGVGKTHLACAIIDKALDNKKSCYYVQYYRLADIKIKDAQLYKALLTVDVLVIDEYGVQDSVNKNNYLFEIINERYNNMVNTIIISNLTLQTFKDNIGEAAHSRLKENVMTQEAAWGDYRKKAK
jgi:DNA replication protein DnaC